MKCKRTLKIIIGFFLILCSIIGIIDTITWLVIKKDYNKEYVYSDSGVLSYEINDERIYIEKIYNSNGEILQLDVPDKKTIIMYCYKDNPTEGIYLGINNTADSKLQYPIISIYVSSFIFVVAICILSKRKIGNPIHDLYLIYVMLLAIGIGMLFWQVNNIINYYSIKNDNHTVNATIYSDIYDTGVSNERYKAVSYYYVDNDKYIYVDETYKNGNINNVLGTTQKLYYNPDNPNKVSSERGSFNIIFLIIGLFIIAITFPIVFFCNQMADRYNKAVRRK